jgi:hypothetical protein
MDYEFWKTVAQLPATTSPATTSNYFKYDTATDMFVGPGGAKKKIEDWLTPRRTASAPASTSSIPRTARNPQYGKGGNAHPAIKISASVRKTLADAGLHLSQCRELRHHRQGNLVDDDVYQMPGEPYRDVGFFDADPATNDYILVGGALPPATTSSSASATSSGTGAT